MLHESVAPQPPAPLRAGGALEPAEASRNESCPPSELFCRLFSDLEESVSLLEPALQVVRALLDAADAPAVTSDEPDRYADTLIGWARARLEPVSATGCVSSWPARMVREFAPVGLSDGCWLRGLVSSSIVDTELGQSLLEQFVHRVGDPAVHEGHAQRYSALLQSLGVPPGSITRWEWADSPVCADISYEHALLGLCLGCFPSLFLPETLGFNLWMAALGPAPLLEQLTGSLRERGGNVRYLERPDGTAMAALARRSLELALSAADAEETRRRVGRGFAAAHCSYERWLSAMRGRNVPFTPRESVLEMIQRKVRFSADHHRDVRIAKRNLEELMREGGASHEWLLDRLGASALVCPGKPDQSRFMTHTLSIDGPMFDSFTASEKIDLNDWIRTLPLPRGAAPARLQPVSLAAQYPGPAPRESLDSYASADAAELLRCVSNADPQPAARGFAKAYLKELLATLNRAFEDERLQGVQPPAHSEHGLADWVLEQTREARRARTANEPPQASNVATRKHDLDATWLRGSTDVRRLAFEENAWLFRSYRQRHDAATLPLQEQRPSAPSELLAAMCVDPRSPAGERAERCASIIAGCLALESWSFMPEILGLNLALTTASEGLAGDTPVNPRTGERTLAALTEWALASTQAFLRHTRDGSPAAVEAHWKRIWRAFRCGAILSRGTASERAALKQHFDPVLRG